MNGNWRLSGGGGWALFFRAHHLLPQCTVLEDVLVPTLAARQTADGRQNAMDRGVRLLDGSAWGREGPSPRPAFRGRTPAGGGGARPDQPAATAAGRRAAGALDRAASEALSQLLLELNTEEKVTLILVTHAPELAGRMQRQCRILDGRLEEKM